MREYSITREDAIAFAESGWWKTMTDQQRAEAQLRQPFLCMPFEVFHSSVEAALDRPVWTHEFADQEGLIAELEHKAPRPTMGDVMRKLTDKIGADRVVSVVVLP